MSNSLLEAALIKFDQLNQQDPRMLKWEGRNYPQEYFLALQLTIWIEKLEPKPSEALLLASRCQHLCRWKIARSSFKEGQKGYLQWRKTLGEFHAAEAEKVLTEVGYSKEVIEAVKAINLKKNLKNNRDTQTMEDALCLVFLQFQFREFLNKTPAEKMPNIIRKTWAKMSDRGHSRALKLPFSSEELATIQQALTVAPEKES